MSLARAQARASARTRSRSRFRSRFRAPAAGLFLSLVLAVSLLTGCVTAPAPSGPLVPEQGIPSTEVATRTDLDAGIAAFLADYAAAYNRQDYSTLLGMWDQDDPDVFYMAEELDPPMHGWKTIRAYFARTGVLDGIRNEYSQVRAHRVAPDIAIATYRLRFDIKVRNMEPLSSWDRVMAVFRHKDGHWKLIAYAEAPQAPLTMIRKALKTSKSLSAAEQKELLRTVQTLLTDAVPDDFDQWLEQSRQEHR